MIYNLVRLILSCKILDMCFCEISLDYLNEVRAVQPVFSHRRNDLYCLIAHEKQEIGSSIFFAFNLSLIKNLSIKQELKFIFIVSFSTFLD